MSGRPFDSRKRCNRHCLASLQWLGLEIQLVRFGLQRPELSGKITRVRGVGELLLGLLT